MIKKVICLFLSVLMLHGVTSAQLSMSVPHGSFEQWTPHDGYSVTALIFQISVYSSFSTPTGWDYLSYPVNESMSVYGMDININTDLPLIKASQETGAVPDSSSAVKLQTFMLSDIISSTVYSMAASSIDTMLTNMVFPSILSTGTMDLDHFMPVITDLMSNMDNLDALLASLLDEDINYYITGGLPLDGFVPTRLTGSYKYSSAISGDNGGVIILGTRYNTTLHKRQLVGGGANIALSDCTDYTPFTVDYESLNGYDASIPVQEPDSLIVLLVSSASLDRQQGSWLCVDNLVLWHDTCAAITTPTAVADIHEAVLSWGSNGDVDGFEMEYGVAGYVQGDGTEVATTENSYSFTGLAASTQYDVYIRTVCTNNIYGDWMQYSFTTLPDTCTGVLGLEVVAESDSPSEYILSWSGYFDPNAWEVEYGLRGFELGSGTLLTQNETALNLSTLGLQGNNWYDIYVRSVCSDNVYGEWSMVQFHTDPDTCANILSITIDTSAASINSDSLISGYTASWTSSFDPDGWEVEYGLEGFAPDAGIAVTVQQPTYTFEPLSPDSQYELRVRSVCNDSIHGEWSSVVFHTSALPPAVAIDNSSLSHTIDIAVVPNPANGRCTVTLPDAQPAEMRLYAPDGRLLHTVATNTPSVSFSLPMPGIFLLQVITNDGSASCRIINQ